MPHTANRISELMFPESIWEWVIVFMKLNANQFARNRRTGHWLVSCISINEITVYGLHNMGYILAVSAGSAFVVDAAMPTPGSLSSGCDRSILPFRLPRDRSHGRRFGLAISRDLPVRESPRQRHRSSGPT